jgi:hypothetical protein
MMIVRFSAPVLLAASILMSGCKKTDKAPAAEPAASAGSAAPATPPAAPATPPAAQPPAAGGGPVVPAAKLEEIELPTPKGGPAKGIWSAATASDDGDRSTNFVDGSDLWIGVHFLDCNLPKAKEGAVDFKACTGAPTGKIKDYPLFAPSDVARVVKAGHILVIATAGATHMDKVKGPELEEFLASVDLDAIAKL